MTGVLRKVLIVACVALLGWQSWSFSRASVLRLTDPAAALGINPKEPVALAAQADALMVAKSGDTAALKEAGLLSKASLRAQALNPRALRLQAFVNAKTWSSEQQRRAIALVLRASRREPGAYIWNIEDAAARDDVGAVLKNYDLALRTKTESGTVLFPILSNALSDARIRSELAPYFKKNPVWLVDFVGYALENSKDPLPLAMTVTTAGGLPPQPEFKVLGQRLLRTLVETGHATQAKATALSLYPADRKLLTSLDLSDAATALRNPELAWQSTGSASAGAGFDVGADGRPIMTLFAGTGVRQGAARKLLFLEAGSYHLAAKFGATDSPNGAGMAWHLRCLGEGARAAWTSGIITPVAQSSYDAIVAVPGACPAQAMEIEMIGGEEQRDVQFEVTALTLVQSPTSK